MTTNRLLARCSALSLSLSLLVGCTSPAAVPTATEPTTPVAVADTPAAQPTAQPAPAAVVPTTLDGKVVFKGQPVAGYAVTVYDARTNLPVERKADLNGATGLAVLDQNLVTDDKGGFKLQVVGLAPGQALRVVASKGKTSLEAIVSSELQTLGAKQRRVLATDVTLTLSELTTAMAKIARNVVLTTQVLTPEAAAPVLAKLMADLDALSAQLDEQLKQVPAMADELVKAESLDAIGKTEASALNVLINNAGLLKETTKSIAELVAEIAKQSKDPASRSTAAADPKLVEALSKVVYVGTVLTGALNGTDGTFSLFNSVTGGQIDPSTGIGTIADRVTPNHSANESKGDHVRTEQELLTALQNTSLTTIYLDNSITLDLHTVLNINRAVTIDGGSHSYSLLSETPDTYRLLNVGSSTIEVTSPGVTMKNLTISCPVVVTEECANEGAAFDKVTFSQVISSSTPCLEVEALGKATLSNDCQFHGANASNGRGIVAAGDIEVDHTTFSNFYHAIVISPDSATAPQITNCSLTSNQIAIYFDDGNITADDVVGITDNHFIATLPNGAGISFETITYNAFGINLEGANDFSLLGGIFWLQVRNV